MSEEVQNQRVDSILDRINSLNNVFEQAEKVCAEEIVEFVDSKQKEVQLYSEEPKGVDATKVIELEFLVSDFKFTRETLKETVENGRKVIQIVTLELLDDDSDNRASLITSFAELVSSVNQSVKLLSQTYKDIAAVLESIEKTRKSQLSGPKQTGGTVNIDKMVITTEASSTADIIARLREKNNG